MQLNGLQKKLNTSIRLAQMSVITATLLLVCVLATGCASSANSPVACPVPPPPPAVVMTKSKVDFRARLQKMLLESDEKPTKWQDN